MLDNNFFAPILRSNVLTLTAKDPVICIPCTFFIGGDGQPLEGIVGSLSAEQFLEKAKETIQV